MESLFLPKSYKSTLDVQTTEMAIKFIKDHFQIDLSAELKLSRVTAPMMVLSGTGINDDLNGIEKPVNFAIKGITASAEIVHSLAKWKRLKLAEMGVQAGRGIYTDMNALRPDEILSNIHSVYVDQWDWEMVIAPEQRTLNFLKEIVRKIYGTMKRIEFRTYQQFPDIKPVLPDEITFIHAEDLQLQYPDKTPKEREDIVAREYGAVFIIGIGGDLLDGKPHDGRAPDYDDWTSETTSKYKGLNGDIIVWNPVLERAFEISSMGIRVDKQALLKQLRIRDEEGRLKFDFHKKLIDNKLPLTLGGGIGQSRLCMFFLRKAHIGEVQASIWPGEMMEACKKSNIDLL